MSLRCWMGVALVMVKGRRGAVKGKGAGHDSGSWAVALSRVGDS